MDLAEDPDGDRDGNADGDREVAVDPPEGQPSLLSPHNGWSTGSAWATTFRKKRYKRQPAAQDVQLPESPQVQRWSPSGFVGQLRKPVSPGQVALPSDSVQKRSPVQEDQVAQLQRHVALQTALRCRYPKPHIPQSSISVLVV